MNLRLLAIILFAIAAVIEIGTSVALMKGKIEANPLAVAGIISGLIIGFIGLMSFLRAGK